MEELTPEQIEALKAQYKIHIEAADFVMGVLLYAKEMGIKLDPSVGNKLAKVNSYLQGYYYLPAVEGETEIAVQGLLNGVVAAYILGLIQDKPVDNNKEVLQ